MGSGTEAASVSHRRQGGLDLRAVPGFDADDPQCRRPPRSSAAGRPGAVQARPARRSAVGAPPACRAPRSPRMALSERVGQRGRIAGGSGYLDRFAQQAPGSARARRRSEARWPAARAPAPAAGRRPGGPAPRPRAPARARSPPRRSGWSIPGCWRARRGRGGLRRRAPRASPRRRAASGETRGSRPGAGPPPDRSTARSARSDRRPAPGRGARAPGDTSARPHPGRAAGARAPPPAARSGSPCAVSALTTAAAQWPASSPSRSPGSSPALLLQRFGDPLVQPRAAGSARDPHTACARRARG